MAHFAELESKVDPTGFTLNTHQIVKRVVVVGNDIAANGGTLGDNDMHVDGETWCANFFKGGSWKQTSYNNKFRKQFAGVGMIYDPVKDKFLNIQPFQSWSLDFNDDWRAPITYPTIVNYTSTWTQEHADNNIIPDGKSVGDERIAQYTIVWDEKNQKWNATDNEAEQNNFTWDALALTWISA